MTNTALVREGDLLLARSYEDRCTAVLVHAGGEGWQVGRVYTIGFSEYRSPPGPSANPLDREAHDQYWKKSAECDKLISEMGTKSDQFTLSLNSGRGIVAVADQVMGSASHSLVVDISSFPRLHLTALAWALLSRAQVHHKQLYLAYTRVGQHLKDEERFSVGVKRFAAIPGLSGKIRHQDSVAVIIAGFEGNRAYAAFRHLSPRRTHVLLGDSQDDSSDFYLRTSRSNNHELLANHRVDHSQGPSLDAVAFAGTLSMVVNDLKNRFGPCNVYVVPLGTKIQTIGAALVAQEFPEIQYLFTLPVHRRKSAGGVGATRFLDLSEFARKYREDKGRSVQWFCEVPFSR
jgi:hypothetical protein